MKFMIVFAYRRCSSRPRYLQSGVTVSPRSKCRWSPPQARRREALRVSDQRANKEEPSVALLRG